MDMAAPALARLCPLHSRQTLCTCKDPAGAELTAVPSAARQSLSGLPQNKNRPRRARDTHRSVSAKLATHVDRRVEARPCAVEDAGAWCDAGVGRAVVPRGEG